MQLPGLLTKEQMQLEPLGRTNDPGPRSLRENEGQRQAIGSSFVFQVRLIDGSGSIGIAVLGEALLACFARRMGCRRQRLQPEKQGWVCYENGLYAT